MQSFNLPHQECHSWNVDGRLAISEAGHGSFRNLQVGRRNVRSKPHNAAQGCDKVSLQCSFHSALSAYILLSGFAFFAMRIGAIDGRVIRSLLMLTGRKIGEDGGKALNWARRASLRESLRLEISLSIVEWVTGEVESGLR